MEAFLLIDILKGLGNKPTQRDHPHQSSNQNLISFPSPTRKPTHLNKVSHLTLDTSPTEAMTLQTPNLWWVGPDLSYHPHFSSLYLEAITLCQRSSSFFSSNLHHHLAKKAQFSFSKVPTPRPPFALGLTISLHFSKWISFWHPYHRIENPPEFNPTSLNHHLRHPKQQYIINLKIWQASFNENNSPAQSLAFSKKDSFSF